MASNIIPFSKARAKNRDEIKHLTDWREQIYGQLDTLTPLGYEMANVLLDSITRDLSALGYPEGGRAA